MLPQPTFCKLCHARDLIRDCFAEPISLADAAAEADLSASHFLRLFRSAFGETPHEFLTRLRIERAKDLLGCSSRSVTDICLDVGFSSLGSFSTLFARHVGLSPRAYRREVRSWVLVPGPCAAVYVPACFALMFAGRIARSEKNRATRGATLSLCSSVPVRSPLSEGSL